MLHQNTAMLLLLIQIRIMRISSHTVEVSLFFIDARNTKVFEIVLDDMNYDEENENEMIQPADLADLKSLISEDEDRYRLLHSHVKRYNEHNGQGKIQLSNVFPRLQPHAEEIFNLEQEDRPFVVGFKHELDKFFHEAITRTTIAYEASIKTSNRYKNGTSLQNLKRSYNRRNGTTVVAGKAASRRMKREEEKEDHYGATSDKGSDFFQAIRNRNVTTSRTETINETTERLGETTRVLYDAYEYSQETTKMQNEDTENNILNLFSSTETRSALTDTESPEEESYDYEKFKAEYEQQLEHSVMRGETLNYTEREKSEDTPREALKRIIDLKRPANCTKEEMSQIGIKAIECLVYDYRHAKDVATVRRLLSRTWLILRVWLLIYLCLAIPCWCQRGWCCCCFRCKFCFPRKRILLAKQYYAINPPGTLIKDLKKTKDAQKPIEYKATEHENDVYEVFETAIKNI